LNDKTLVIGPSWVGDMVMAQALFQAIQQQYPQTAIEVLAPQWSHALTQRMPEISRSMVMPFKHGELNLKARWQLAKQLRAQHYQRAFVLPNSFKSALIPFWAKIPQRIGYQREGRRLLLNKSYKLDKQRFALMIQRYLALVFAHQDFCYQSFKPKLVVNPKNLVDALRQYQLPTPPHKSLLIICPGAEFGASKRWPAHYYAQLANRYLKKNWHVWIMGSAKDSEVAAAIQADTQDQCADLTGKTTLAEAIDLMSLANLVISNDSGLMHIAAALSRPLVAIYGSTDPNFTPPLNTNVQILKEAVPCSPCFKRVCPLKHHQCMTLLSVQRVFDASQQLVTA